MLHPDGRMLGTAQSAPTLTLVWDLSDPTSPEVIMELAGKPQNNLSYLAYNPDSRTLRGIASDTSIRSEPPRSSPPSWTTLITWRPDVDDAARVVCDATPPLTRAEWSTHFGDMLWQDHCR